jgi:hypothetical protein
MNVSLIRIFFSNVPAKDIERPIPNLPLSSSQTSLNLKKCFEKDQAKLPNKKHPTTV